MRKMVYVFSCLDAGEISDGNKGRWYSCRLEKWINYLQNNPKARLSDHLRTLVRQPKCIVSKIVHGTEYYKSTVEEALVIYRPEQWNMLDVKTNLDDAKNQTEWFEHLKLCTCMSQPDGHRGLEGYQVGCNYKHEFIEREPKSDSYYRVWPTGYDYGSYQTCSRIVFKQFFKPKERSNAF